MKRPRWAGLLVFLPLILGSISTAQMFYVTSEPGQQLDLVDFSSGTVTNIYDIGSRPDSVIVNAQGQIFYTVTPLGTLQMFDPNTGLDSVLATFPSGYPRDLVFDPEGKNILVSLYGIGKLGRYNLASGTATIFPSTPIGLTLDGLAYDPAGNLFAVVSHNTVCQLDPTTGAILQTLILEPPLNLNGGDGVVYDPFTKNLWVTRVSTLGDGLIEIPLTESAPPVLGTPIFLQTGNMVTPDGVISDGQGNLYIGEGLQHLTEYNVPTDNILKRVLSPGIDDMAFVPVAIPPQFSVAITPPSITALDNQSVSFTLNITTTNNYAPTFQVSCAGLPSPAVCTVANSVPVGSTQIQVQTQSLPVGSYDFSLTVSDGVTTKTALANLAIADFAASLSSSSITLEVGKSAAVGVTVTTQGGYSNPVTLTCSSPSGTTCTLNPASVVPSSAGTSSTLTISVVTRPAGNASSVGSVAGFASWACLAIGVLIFPASSSTRQGRGLLGCVLLILLVLGVSCGGNSHSVTSAGGSAPTTFVVSVQATSENTVQNAGNVTVTVP
jgi:sugar lactone lactonase YvrE